MKIAITVSQISQGGGLSKYVVTLADILTREGVNEVWVITTHTSTANDEFDIICRDRDVHYIDLGVKGKLGKYVSLLRSIRSICPDVLICNYNATTQYILPFLSPKIRILHVIHNNTEDFYRVAAINARYVSQWIAPTPAVVNQFNRYTQAKYSKRVIAIPHGVAIPKELQRKKGNSVELIYVGVLYEHKGVKILPPIIKKLRKKGLDFKFTFVGEGVLRDELQSQLKDEMRDGIVTFTGRVSGEEVYRRLSLADIFVYPTHIDSFGLVIAEAMINLTVPVVTRLVGITDTIIEEGKSGYLLEQDDIDGFVTRIEELIEDQSLLSRMSIEASHRAMTHFSIEVMQNNYLRLLEKLVK